MGKTQLYYSELHNKLKLNSLAGLLSLVMMLWFFMSQIHADEYNQFKLDMLLAERGDPGAQFYVAGALEEGRSVDKDLKKAFEWYSKAAENNHSGAQYKLGEFYANGWGVTKDPVKAEHWYKTAVNNGSQLAIMRLKEMAANKKAATTKQRQEEQKRLESARLKQALAEEKARKEKLARLAAEKARKGKEERLQKQKSAKQKVSNQQPAAKISVSKLIDFILAGNWQDQAGAASLLPSSVNNCLKASENEIVCFSTEQQRKIEDIQLTYTSKSTLTSFDDNGRFKIRYYYNVLNLSSTAGKNAVEDPSGLRSEKGWQEPQQVMQCQYQNSKNLSCIRDRHRFNFTL